MLAYCVARVLRSLLRSHFKISGIIMHIVNLKWHEHTCFYLPRDHHHMLSLWSGGMVEWNSDVAAVPPVHADMVAVPPVHADVAAAPPVHTDVAAAPPMWRLHHQCMQMWRLHHQCVQMWRLHHQCVQM